MNCPVWCGMRRPIPGDAPAWWSEDEPKRAYDTKECRLNGRCVHVAQPETPVEGVPALVDYNKGTITPAARQRGYVMRDPEELETRHRNGYKVRTFYELAGESVVEDDPKFYDTYSHALAAHSSCWAFLEGKLTVEITSVARVDRVEKKAT